MSPPLFTMIKVASPLVAEEQAPEAESEGGVGGGLQGVISAVVAKLASSGLEKL